MRTAKTGREISEHVTTILSIGYSSAAFVFQAIIGHAIYQIAVIFTMFFAGDQIFHNEPGHSHKPTQHYTFCYNVFVLVITEKSGFLDASSHLYRRV